MTELEFLLRTARALVSTSPEKATNFALNSLAKQLIHGCDILSGQHCARLSAKMQRRLVNGSAVLASTNVLDATTD
jgi:hypothetical protein